MVRKRSCVVIFLAILLFAVIILSVIIFTDSGTQSVLAPGVAEGDVFTYEVKGIWNSNDPDATMSDILPQLNMTEWYRVTVTNVSGLEISTYNVWRFTNRTEFEEEGQVDIETGIYSGGFWAIYAANLRANDRIRPFGGTDQSTVNDTITKDYKSGVKRETNRLLLITQFYNVNDPTRTYDDYITINFDKQTGILVELSNEKIYSNPEATEIILWKLTDSNVWAVA